MYTNAVCTCIDAKKNQVKRHTALVGSHQHSPAQFYSWVNIPKVFLSSCGSQLMSFIPTTTLRVCFLCTFVAYFTALFLFSLPHTLSSVIHYTPDSSCTYIHYHSHITWIQCGSLRTEHQKSPLFTHYTTKRYIHATIVDIYTQACTTYVISGSACTACSNPQAQVHYKRTR